VNNTTEYLRLIRGARHVVLGGTGHLGTITHPAAFAGAVTRFLDDVRMQNDEVA
jgi:pimeloyl-ACP methyl ester carboxylesterase